MKKTDLKKGVCLIHNYWSRNILNNYNNPKPDSKGKTLQTITTFIKKHSILTLKYKGLIYLTFIRPIWTYGAELWGPTEPSKSRRNLPCQSWTLTFPSPTLTPIMTSISHSFPILLHLDIVTSIPAFLLVPIP